MFLFYILLIFNKLPNLEKILYKNKAHCNFFFSILYLLLFVFLVQNEQQTPTNVCDIFDIYTNSGENRLTFLCQIRPTRERRSKSIKYSIVAQLIE